MSRELLILRHAKSDWGDMSRGDEQRTLSARGREDAPRMGSYMHEYLPLPQKVLCSTATRARETLELVNRMLGLGADCIEYHSELYLASLETLLTQLAQIEDSTSPVMLVGHNPGLDELVLYLSQTPPPRTSSGKLMTTCCLAYFAMPDNWGGYLRQQAELLSIIRPSDL